VVAVADLFLMTAVAMATLAKATHKSSKNYSLFFFLA
jgi:hypothetical protein